MDMKLFLLKKEGEEIPVKQQIKVIANDYVELIF